MPLYRHLLMPSVTLGMVLALTSCNEPRNNDDKVALNKEMEDRYIKMDPYGPDAPFLVMKREPVLTQSQGVIFITDEARPYIMSAKEFREWSGTAISAERAQRIIDHAELQRRLFSDINTHLKGLADSLEEVDGQRKATRSAEGHASAIRKSHQSVVEERDDLVKNADSHDALVDAAQSAQRRAESVSERDRNDRARAEAKAQESGYEATQAREDARMTVAAAQREAQALNDRITDLGSQVTSLLSQRADLTAKLTAAQSQATQAASELDKLKANAASAGSDPQTSSLSQELEAANLAVAKSDQICASLVQDNRKINAQLSVALDQLSTAQRVLDGSLMGTNKELMALDLSNQINLLCNKISPLPVDSPERVILLKDLELFCAILEKNTGHSTPVQAQLLLKGK